MLEVILAINLKDSNNTGIREMKTLWKTPSPTQLQQKSFQTSIRPFQDFSFWVFLIL